MLHPNIITNSIYGAAGAPNRGFLPMRSPQIEAILSWATISSQQASASSFIIHSLPQLEWDSTGSRRWSFLVQSSAQWLCFSPTGEAAQYKLQQSSSIIIHRHTRGCNTHMWELHWTAIAILVSYDLLKLWCQWWWRWLWRRVSVMKQSTAWDIKTCVKRPPEMGSNRVNTTLHHWLTPQIHPLLWDGL